MSDQAQKFVKRAARHYRWKLQSDPGFLDQVTAGLELNRTRYGYYLCPCREGWANKRKDRDITCPCDYAEEDILDYGHCYCGLFCSQEFVASGQLVGPIPDRRPEHLYPE
ncbi:MAG: ferredoxin:thioredoxin reductase [Spirochaetales bacterium]|nr:ferredoxin:thioredoxin reductase [Spirochaetales bacterium]